MILVIMKLFYRFTGINDMGGGRGLDSFERPYTRHAVEGGKAGKEAGEATDKRRTILRGGVIALAVLVGLIAWGVTRDDDDGGESEIAPAGFEAKIVSEVDLEEIAVSSGHDVYWVGPIDGKELETGENEDGGVLVRYLQAGEEPGSDSAGALAIGSYPLGDAVKALERFAEGEGAIVRESDQVGKVVTSREAPTSAYFVSPDGTLQIEVYDPSPARAMTLALSGRVRPVG